MLDPKTVMVVDDDSEIRDSVILRLTSSGYSVTSAVDGQDAIDQIMMHHPHVVIMDSRMPRKDGMAALIELKTRADTQDIPVVMISASVIDKRRALDAGARFFIAKPYKSSDLLNAIHVSLREQRHDQSLGQEVSSSI